MPATTDPLELLHASTDRASIVTVPDRRMLALDGVGSPTGSDFRVAIETLHAVADGLRARVRREQRVDTRLAPIECAWWTHPEPPADEMAQRFEERIGWHWQLMAEVPRQATDDDVAAALAGARHGGVDHAAHVRATRSPAGRSAQVLVVGGPAAARRAVALLYREMEAAGARAHGHLHEIFLSDPRLASPDRQRAILRLPISDGSEDVHR